MLDLASTVITVNGQPDERLQDAKNPVDIQTISLPEEPDVTFDLLKRRTTHFVLWVPSGSQKPSLILGNLVPGNPATFRQLISVELQPATAPSGPSLWEFPCSALELPNGVYHYWFKIQDTSPNNFGQMLVTDPFAYTVDYRLTQSPALQPAAVIKLDGGRLRACDAAGGVPAPALPPKLSSLPPNNQIVIYELPTTWSRLSTESADANEPDIGTFRDVLALLDKDEPGGNFSNDPAIHDEAILSDLGINALELLPVADSKDRREWGYSTAHYFAPDYDLGDSKGYPSPQPSVDLTILINRCHDMGIRFFSDIVMAFGYDPYIYIAYSQFHLRPKDEPNNPDSYQSGGQGPRDPFGGESWRYVQATNAYDPETGKVQTICPASVFHRAHLERWMSDFHVDSVRLDSLNNVANWDFIRKFRQDARSFFRARYPTSEDDPVRDARFLVVGEELSVPLDLITTGGVDALWNDKFQYRLRASIVGETVDGDGFEGTVRRMIDCRLLGFGDGSQAVNYITSHDTEGDNNGYLRCRLYDYLQSKGVFEKEQRAKLAFACQLTAVGIPMVLAGEEFCDQQDKKAVFPDKERDPVNWARKADPWRSSVFDYVARLIGLRKRSGALGVNDVDFIHSDFTNGRKILAWVRGRRGVDALVVVVANFSDVETPEPEYVVRNWPATTPGARWREITQVREVPPEWVGREPLYPWEAKVYEMYDPNKS
jgi:pullulanase